MSKPVFLIGYMGSGKTTLGRAVAEAMGLTFIDLDEAIEESHHRSIVEIFDEMGENRFREIERETLARIATKRDCIVATGGGTVCRDGAVEQLNSYGLTVWLDPTRQRMLERLCLPEERVKRPKLAGLSDDGIARLISRELGERNAYYRRARVRFDSTHLESAEEIASSARALARLIISFTDD